MLRNPDQVIQLIRSAATLLAVAGALCFFNLLFAPGVASIALAMALILVAEFAADTQNRLSEPEHELD